MRWAHHQARVQAMGSIDRSRTDPNKRGRQFIRQAADGRVQTPFPRVMLHPADRAAFEPHLTYRLCDGVSDDLRLSFPSAGGPDVLHWQKVEAGQPGGFQTANTVDPGGLERCAMTDSVAHHAGPRSIREHPLEMILAA
jgi:hypothetical protein